MPSFKTFQYNNQTIHVDTEWDKGNYPSLETSNKNDELLKKIMVGVSTSVGNEQKTIHIARIVKKSNDQFEVAVVFGRTAKIMTVAINAIQNNSLASVNSRSSSPTSEQKETHPSYEKIQIKSEVVKEKNPEQDSDDDSDDEEETKKDSRDTSLVDWIKKIDKCAADEKEKDDNFISGKTPIEINVPSDQDMPAQKSNEHKFSEDEYYRVAGCVPFKAQIFDQAKQKCDEYKNKITVSLESVMSESKEDKYNHTQFSKLTVDSVNKLKTLASNSSRYHGVFDKLQKDFVTKLFGKNENNEQATMADLYQTYMSNSAFENLIKDQLYFVLDRTIREYVKKIVLDQKQKNLIKTNVEDFRNRLGTYYRLTSSGLEFVGNRPATIQGVVELINNIFKPLYNGRLYAAHPLTSELRKGLDTWAANKDVAAKIDYTPGGKSGSAHEIKLNVKSEVVSESVKKKMQDREVIKREFSSNVEKKLEELDKIYSSCTIYKKENANKQPALKNSYIVVNNVLYYVKNGGELSQLVQSNYVINCIEPDEASKTVKPSVISELAPQHTPRNDIEFYLNEIENVRQELIKIEKERAALLEDVDSAKVLHAHISKYHDPSSDEFKSLLDIRDQVETFSGKCDVEFKKESYKLKYPTSKLREILVAINGCKENANIADTLQSLADIRSAHKANTEKLDGIDKNIKQQIASFEKFLADLKDQFIKKIQVQSDYAKSQLVTAERVYKTLSSEYKKTDDQIAALKKDCPNVRELVACHHSLVDEHKNIDTECDKTIDLIRNQIDDITQANKISDAEVIVLDLNKKVDHIKSCASIAIQKYKSILEDANKIVLSKKSIDEELAKALGELGSIKVSRDALARKISQLTSDDKNEYDSILNNPINKKFAELNELMGSSQFSSIDYVQNNITRPVADLKLIILNYSKKIDNLLQSNNESKEQKTKNPVTVSSNASSLFNSSSSISKKEDKDEVKFIDHGMVYVLEYLKKDLNNLEKWKQVATGMRSNKVKVEFSNTENKVDKFELPNAIVDMMTIANSENLSPQEIITTLCQYADSFSDSESKELNKFVGYVRQIKVESSLAILDKLVGADDLVGLIDQIISNMNVKEMRLMMQDAVFNLNLKYPNNNTLTANQKPIDYIFEMAKLSSEKFIDKDALLTRKDNQNCYQFYQLMSTVQYLVNERQLGAALIALKGFQESLIEEQNKNKSSVTKPKM